MLDFQHTGAGNAAASDLCWRYLWGPAVDRILAEEEAGGGTADLVAWTLTDHLNTVRDIAKYDPQTGTTTVVNHLVYDAFGKVTSESEPPTNRAHLMGSRRREPAVDFLLLFTRRPFDADTGLQNNLNRWYDAAVGRWLSQDPVEADINLYRYSHNNPIINADPKGLDVQWTRRVDGYTVTYMVAVQNWRPPDWIGGSLYPGRWGQPRWATSGSYSWEWGAQTRVNLSGGNVCNTIQPGATGSNDAGLIRASVYLEPGCYDVLWHWEVSSSGNAIAGIAKVIAPSGTRRGKTRRDKTEVLPGGTKLVPGFHGAGSETTRVWVDTRGSGRSEVPIAIYDPTLSRSAVTGWDEKRAYSSTTGKIILLQIKKVGN